MRTYRELAKAYIELVSERTGRPISQLARDIGSAHTTFTRFVNDNSYKPVVKFDKLMKLAELTSVPIPPELVASQAFEGAMEVPVISAVSAGRLKEVTVSELGEDTRKILQRDLEPGDYFAMQVHGDSMDRVSPDGSIIIVNASDIALRPNRLYVFLHEFEGVTYKRWREKPDRMEPYSTNPESPTFFPKGNEFAVLGRVRRTVLDL